MTERDRSELLGRIADLSRACPEMRIGQLIASLSVVARGTDSNAIWEMEDEELLAAVIWQHNELQKRRGIEVA